MDNSGFVFPERVFGPVQEHRSSVQVWGDGFFGDATRPSSYEYGQSYPKGYGGYYETYDDMEYTPMALMGLPRRVSLSPSSRGYQRSFTNAYFKSATPADDGIYRSTPPPPALVDDTSRFRMTPTSGGAFYDDMARYRASPPSPMPYASLAGGMVNGRMSGYSTPTRVVEEDFRAIVMPPIVKREPVMAETQSIRQVATPTVVQNEATLLPTRFVETSPVVSTIVKELVPPMIPMVAPAPLPLPAPPVVAELGLSTPTVAVSVEEPVLLPVPTPEMVFTPPPLITPSVAVASAAMPRTVIEPVWESRPPTVVREIGPALPPSPLPISVSLASIMADSRASTPPPQNASAQVPVATPSQITRSLQGSPVPPGMNNYGPQVPVATPPGMGVGPMGPRPGMRDSNGSVGSFGTPPATPPAAVVEEKEERAHGFKRFTQKIHRK